MLAWTATMGSQGEWTFQWTSVVDRVYEIWLNGRLLGTVTATTTTSTYYFALDGYPITPPPLEVHDTTVGSAENDLNPPFAILQWQGIVDAAGYVVEKEISPSVWSIVHNATERDQGYYTYTTQEIDDQTATKFRVTAVDEKGTKGASIEFTVEVVRNPKTPSVDLEVSGGDLIMSEPS